MVRAFHDGHDHTDAPTGEPVLVGSCPIEIKGSSYIIEVKEVVPTDPTDPPPVDPPPTDPDDDHDHEPPPVDPPTGDIPTTITLHHGETVPVPNFGDVVIVDDLTLEDTAYFKENIIVRGILRLKGHVEIACRNLFGLPGSVIWGPNISGSITILDLPLVEGSSKTWQNGIFGVDCVFNVSGEAVTPYVRLTHEVAPNTNQLLLEKSPVGWQSSEDILLPSTSGGAYRPIASNYEYLPIASVIENELNLSTPVLTEHRGGRNVDGVLEKFPHVAYMDRSFKIKSENPAGVRGNIIFTGHGDVDVDSIGIEFIGRTRPVALGPDNPIGGYGWHFHHYFGPMNPTKPFQGSITNCLMIDDNSTKWGFVVHESNYIRVKGNTALNMGGPAIVTEAGNESYCDFRENLVIQMKNPGDNTSEMKQGIRADAFWFRGPHNYVEGNITYGLGNGFTYFSQVDGSRGRDILIPSAPGKMPDVKANLQSLPVLSFKGNETIKAFHPVEIWDVGRLLNEEGPWSEFEDLVAWNGSNRDGGIFAYSGNNLRYKNCRLLGETQYIHSTHKTYRSLAPKYKMCRGEALSIRNRDEFNWEIVDCEAIGYLQAGEMPLEDFHTPSAPVI